MVCTECTQYVHTIEKQSVNKDNALFSLQMNCNRLTKTSDVLVMFGFFFMELLLVLPILEQDNQQFDDTVLGPYLEQEQR